jgi:capsular polysaccharide transport system permease protein
VIPAILIAFYLVALAPSRYVTEASILVKEAGVAQIQAGLLEGLGFAAAGPSTDDQLLQAYVTSPNLLNILDEQLGVKEHYSQSRDFIFGLSVNDSYEDFIAFYRKHVSVGPDSQTGLLAIGVQAYTPEFSKALAEALLSHSEAFVNEASQNIARREMQFALDEITRSQKMLKEAKQALLAFQNTHNLVSPDAEGESLFTIVAELEGELAQTEAAISQGESYLNADAPQVMVMRSKAKALSKEIAAQKQRITGAAESGEKLNELSAQFQSLAVDLELAKTLHASALNAYEMSRVQAGKQLKHLIVASSPQLAQEAVLPKRGYWFATWLLFLLVVWGICRLVIASSNEHKD